MESPFTSISIHLKIYTFRTYDTPCTLPLLSPLKSTGEAAGAAVFWLVTHLSIDRLDRLRALCMSWKGPLAAAVWFPPSISAKDRNHGDILVDFLIKEVAEKNNMCHLRIVKVDNYFVNHSTLWGDTPKLNKRVTVTD